MAISPSDTQVNRNMSGNQNLYYIIAAVVTVVSILAVQILFKSSADKPALDKNVFREFPLIQKTVLTHNSAVYRFGLARPTDNLGLPIGQHISVAAYINDKEIVRSYTPTSSDDDKGYFDLLIKSYPNGNVSKYVSELKLGDLVKVRGPKGQFNYTNGLVREFGMVAGGTGITPMYQIMKAIAKDPNDKTKVSLIYANVSVDDILLKKEIDELVAENDNINVHYVLDRPPEGWTGSTGFVTADILKAHAPAPAADVKLLLCGPPPMVSAVKKAAVTLGYEKGKPVSKLEDQVFAF
ncbi:Cbr1p [Sugiyamaella lignohabitans]|uniref:NADH-cytochrome b5 reductase n=1 Tax=Sugiyamaella lignohabitans TaxID=796027 RepID=A0A167FNN5_9ASCO|nr:Cbr1p [Sugiyamaella lignohabitans]ANB15518.1 Cbr1p [Sugiyamaella lignohabitans]